ncbi:MAG: hypothetical protein GY711_03490 [bacterium]|nr:hypothetical protein [bacterium]
MSARSTPAIRAAVVLSAILAALSTSTLQAAPSLAAQDGSTVSFDLLDNGDFAEAPPKILDADGLRRIPWWRTGKGAEQRIEAEGRPALRTGEGEWAEQPVAAYAPAIDGLVVSGAVHGSGRLIVVDGEGGRVAIDVGSAAGGFEAFSIPHAQLSEPLGRPLVPRLTLRLESAGGAALWRDLAVHVALPLPTEAELRAEIVAELTWIFELWLGRALDDMGTETPFLARLFDVITGEPSMTIHGGNSILYDLLRDALQVEDVAAWRAAYDAFLDGYFVHCLNEETGIPRSWDCANDVPIDDAYVEIAPSVGLLVDLALEGPPGVRERARAAAERVGRTVLAHGVLPDGEVAAKYRPRDAAPSTSYPHLRRLNLVAQLERIGRLTGEADYRVAVREAVANFEYRHGWPGTWSEIDPGFDDNFGNYGGMALLMWRASPDEQMFRRLVMSGIEYYLPRWEHALVLGGNIAADQVRCWKILTEVLELEPDLRPRVAPLLRLAARSHFKGEQYPGGAWGDVTIGDFDPKGDLQVGDIKGTPQNFLSGLALIYDPGLAAEPGGPDLRELRAMFTTLLRSSRTAYRREFGYLETRREVQGSNRSAGSLRLAVGLVEMLQRLTPR